MVDVSDVIHRARSVARVPGRLRTAASYFKAPTVELGRWLMRSREHTNFTYDLTPLNRDHLCAFVSVITGQPFDVVDRTIAELESDETVRAHVQRCVAERDGDDADGDARFGRRLGWYAFARLLKPRVVIETGVDKGLGAVVFCSALARNAAEGHPGRYLGLDINPHAGWLLSGAALGHGELVVGDAIASLQQLSAKHAGRVDLYVNDSDHSDAYEAREYLAAEPLLSAHAVILGDNAHCTDKLHRFARSTARNFLFFHEKPARHWYPGAGIGVAFP